MKSFGQLTLKQKQAAVEFATETLITHVVQGVIELTMPTQRLQADLNQVLTAARRAERPRIARNALLQNEPFRAVVDKIAIAAAEGSRYTEDGEVFVEHNQRSLQ